MNKDSLHICLPRWMADSSLPMQPRFIPIPPWVKSINGLPALLPQSSKDAFNENNPYGGGLIMRHYTQIAPKDFDLSPNFEVIKYNIKGAVQFDYKSLWAERL